MNEVIGYPGRTVDGSPEGPAYTTLGILYSPDSDFSVAASGLISMIDEFLEGKTKVYWRALPFVRDSGGGGKSLVCRLYAE